MLLLKKFTKSYFTPRTFQVLCKNFSDLSSLNNNVASEHKISLNQELNLDLQDELLNGNSKTLTPAQQRQVLDEMERNSISMTLKNKPYESISPLLKFNAEKRFDMFSDIMDSMNFEAPTPIQSYAIPVALEQKDLVGIAKTGSGKTLAFMLPAIQYIKKFKHDVRKNTGNYYDNKNKPLA